MGASRNTPPNCGPPGSGRMPHGPRRGRQQAAWRPGASAISANATEQSPRVIYTARGHMGDQRTVLVAACYSHRGFPVSSTFIFGPCLFLKAGSALFLLCVSIGVPSVCVRGVWVGAFCAALLCRPAPYWDLSELLGGGCRWDMEFSFAQFKLRFQIQIPNCFL